MSEVDKQREAHKGSNPLAKALEAIDNTFKEGRDVDLALLREVFARCEIDEHLRVRFFECARYWPKWTKQAMIQGTILSVARSNGEERPFIALFMDMQKHAPSESILTLQAWTVFNTWLGEGGPKSGVDLPVWIWQYFAETAFNIQRLRAKPGQPAVKLLKQLPNALGFLNGRRNVFISDEAELHASLAALLYEVEGNRGATGDARIAVVADALGLTDTRTARRYVAKGRKWQRPPPAWAK